MPISAFSSGLPVDIICSSLPTKLYPDKLVDGYSRCISFSASGGFLMTPCEYEHQAGRAMVKNWKKTICYKGRPIGNCLRCSFRTDGKRLFHFVTSSPPNSCEPLTCSSCRKPVTSTASPTPPGSPTLASAVCTSSSLILFHPRLVPHYRSKCLW